MTIRLYPLIATPAVGKITSRATKECIESTVEDALEKANNLAVPAKTDSESVFDKKGAKDTENVVYDEKDEEAKEAKKSKKFMEESARDFQDDDRDHDADDQAHWDKEDADDRKRDREDHASDSFMSSPRKTTPTFREMKQEEIDPSTAKLDSSNEATIKKGAEQAAPSKQSHNKHLRPDGKRDFWKKNRKDAKQATKIGEDAGVGDDGTPSSFAGIGLAGEAWDIEDADNRMATNAVESTTEGTGMPMFREMIKTTEKALKLTESPRSLTKNDLRRLVKEEYNTIVKEQLRTAKVIDKKLHELRISLVKELLKSGSTTKETVGRPPLVKTLQVSTVSNLIDVPINELVLYFLNNVKASQDHHLVEYHLGCVYFFGN